MKKTIAQHAADILRETENPAVMHGDSGLLDAIGHRAGMKKMHPLDRWKLILAGLERSPDLFQKTHVMGHRGLVRCFTLRTPNG